MLDDDEKPELPTGDSLLEGPMDAEQEGSMDAEQEAQFSLSAAMDEEVMTDVEAHGSHTATGMEDVGLDDDSDDDDLTVSEETEIAYREVFNAFASTPGCPLYQAAAARLLEKHYALVLVDSKLSAKKYIRRYWADPERPQMCSDPKAGFSFEDYLLWEADNYSLSFGEHQRTTFVPSRAHAWADSHQGTNEGQLAMMNDATGAPVAESNSLASSKANKKKAAQRQSNQVANPMYAGLIDGDDGDDDDAAD